MWTIYIYYYWILFANFLLILISVYILSFLLSGLLTSGQNPRMLIYIMIRCGMQMDATWIIHLPLPIHSPHLLCKPGYILVLMLLLWLHFLQFCFPDEVQKHLVDEMSSPVLLMIDVPPATEGKFLCAVLLNTSVMFSLYFLSPRYHRNERNYCSMDGSEVWSDQKKSNHNWEES